MKKLLIILCLATLVGCASLTKPIPPEQQVYWDTLDTATDIYELLNIIFWWKN